MAKTKVENVFKVKQTLVHKAHGLSRITAIEEQTVAGMTLKLLVLEVVGDSLVVKVPTTKADTALRMLASEDDVKTALGIIGGNSKGTKIIWARRAREFQDKLASGELLKLAEVVRDSKKAFTQPEHSFAERTVFNNAFVRLTREVAAIRKVKEETVRAELETMLKKTVAVEEAA